MNVNPTPPSSLSPQERRALLEQLLKEKAAQSDTIRAPDRLSPSGQASSFLIKRLDRKQKFFPLSSAQKRLWLLDQLNPGSPVYNVSFHLRLKGPLNLQALEQSLVEIFNRHEILRVNVIAVDGEPVQFLVPDRTLSLSLIDVTDEVETSRVERVQELVEKEAKHSFNLAEDILLRVNLFRISENDHLFHFVIHHIIFDGWSVGVFFRELTSLYQAFCQNQEVTIHPLPIQYIDYASWEAKNLEEGHLANQMDYWRKKLGGDLPVLEIPLDRPRPNIQSFRAGRESLDLSFALTEELNNLSRQEGVTLFVTLFSVFFTLLGRYTGQEDIVVGTPIARRSHAEVEKLIGVFLNNLVIRADLSGNITFREFLKRIRRTTLDAFAHQEIPFEKLLSELRIERDPGRTPLFQVFFNMLDVRKETKLEFYNLTYETPPFAEIGSIFDLTFYVQNFGDMLRLRLVYNADLFSKERMAELLQQFHHLLVQIVAAPDQTLQTFSLVTPAALQVLPNPSMDMVEPEVVPLAELIRKRAKKTPRQCAIEKNGQQWTYEELDQRAYELAHRLIRNGLEPGDVVAVSGSRSFNLIASMLAAFLSGGVLLSIDPALPEQRKQLMLQEASAKALIIIGGEQGDDIAWTDKIAPENILLLTASSINSSADETERAATQIALPQLSGDDPAYIFFTSGTTGVPKGVKGNHKGLSHFLAWQRDAFSIQPHDRAAQLTALSFDVILRDVFLALVSGGTLCLPEDRLQLDAEATLQWLQEAQVSIVHTVPTLAKTWLGSFPAGVSLPDLRWVFFAGEPLHETLVRQWREHFPHCQIVNLYGPTETTMAKCFYQVPDQVLPGIQPVGRPLPQTQALVLNQAGQLCGIGEPGEIVLRTPFRTLGYINAPDEHARRFVQNPFREDEQDLVYHTGDQGRYRADGQLDILGRLDDQVKIRGNRIELGEIELTLSQHSAVTQAVVTVWEVGGNDKRLVAYMVENPTRPLDLRDLRSFLKSRLPDYMVPASFMTIDVIPLSLNGKVNRKALPIPDLVTNLQDNFVPPQTELEKAIAEIWTDVLKRKQVGIHDNFFELGGHSILATQVATRIRKMFQIDVPLRELFVATTVAQTAVLIERISGQDSEKVEPIPQYSRSVNLPLSYSQERLWFLNQLNPNSYAYNLPGAIRLKGDLNLTCFEQALNEILTRHEGLRTNFDLINDQPVQIITASKPLPITFIDLSTLVEVEQTSKANHIIEEEAHRPFDLRKDLLVRAVLIKLGDQDHIFLLTFHHIVSDGWSRRVFMREFATLYESLVLGATNPLLPLPIQYADFALWQRAWMKGERLEVQLNYWKQKLGGDLPQLELLLDRPRPPVQSLNSATATLQLPASLAQSIKRLSHQENATIFMTLLAAFKLLLYRTTGIDDILVGSPIAGRNRAELESLIGFFLNTLVLRTDLSGNPSFRDLIQRLREVALAAYANQDIPFEKLLEVLRPDRDISRTPIFQVFFNMLNLNESAAALPGLTIEAIASPEIGSKFDLTLYVIEPDDTIAFLLVYNADLFTPERIKELLTQYQHLLSQIVDQPDQQIGSFSLVTDHAGKILPNPHQALTSSRYEPVHVNFSKQAAHAPKCVALLDKYDSWTYEQLESSSNQLANYLRSHDIQSQDVIAVYAHRSASLVWALLGILKAGASFLLLDPTYPAQRLINYLQLAKPTGWLQIETAGSPPEALIDFVSTSSYCCSLALPPTQLRAQKLLENFPSDDPRVIVNSDDLAYVAFTSGSTGHPKGILGSHQPLSHFLQWHIETFGLTGTDRFSMLSGLAHDPLLRDIFTPLSLGATLCIPDQELILLPGELHSWMQQQRISVAHLTPAMGQILITTDHTQNDELATLRYAFFGGEPLTYQVMNSLKQLAPNLTCVNFYGATETPQAMGYSIANSAQPLKTIPLGQGIEGVQLLVLTTTGQLAGIGEVGEIYIRTPYLSRGYVQDEALTQQRFLINHFTNDVNDRVYKTGDLGRYLPSGEVEFLGRSDDQVKIRGFRIELSEIEGILLVHPAVQQAAVSLRATKGGDHRLIAYVVPNQSDFVETPDLRGFLQKQLPDYMIPNSFVVLDTLPLTASGKINRKALPVPDLDSDIKASFVAPRNDTEKIIAQIWGDVLKLKQVGIHDNFFELGGHSLLATQVLSRIKQNFNLALPLRSLFEAPTVSELAITIVEKKFELVQNHKLLELLAGLENLAAQETGAEHNPDSI